MLWPASKRVDALPETGRAMVEAAHELVKSAYREHVDGEFFRDVQAYAGRLRREAERVLKDRDDAGLRTKIKLLEDIESGRFAWEACEQRCADAEDRIVADFEAQEYRHQALAGTGRAGGHS